MTAVTAVTDHTDQTGDDVPEKGDDRTGERTFERPGGSQGDRGLSERAPGARCEERRAAAPDRAADAPAGPGREQRARGGSDAHARVPDRSGGGASGRPASASASASASGSEGGSVGGSSGDPSGDPSARAESGDPWDDGLIARRVTEAGATERAPGTENRAPVAQPAPLAYDGRLRSRLDALRELVGASRTRLDSTTLAEAGRVLDEAAARRRLSGQHTVVAIAGATGSGKSMLFNSLAGVTISETGVRRPTTAAPIACSWSDGAASLIDRLGIPGRLRRRPLQSPEAEAQLRGLVLVDLPDHDSAAVQHREQVDRILALVDAVIWVVDPEKYADAVLHERYLRPLAGHAEVMFVVLNQVDRLPGEAAHQVLDDLRRLLDEDGIALGEHGEPGATVLALSALTGDGVGELRDTLSQFVAERGAPARRVRADLDAAAARLWPVYANQRRAGLSEPARDEFAARLADAVGATAAGEAAERLWLRHANRACGTPWLRLWRWYRGRAEPPTGRLALAAPVDEESTARQRVEHAVRTLSERAATGLPAPWAQAVREAAVRGAQGLPEALDELAVRVGAPTGRPPRPGWWPAAVLAQASMTLLQVVGGLWLLGQIIGFMTPNLGVPVLLMVIGIVGGPAVEWGCRMAARGPARRYGHEAERRLREAAAGCGRARVLDPVAAELLRYREVREQYGRVLGTAPVG
ncbi:MULTISPECIES: YfjP family GTPase [Streptomyces]|nr:MULTISPECIES: YfjP family GTPase [Streptomyces]MBP5863659.1 ATP-binding protein [Streptomyces sp. LBUM 1484]MBP5867371.1 ATP-binding protein [Streptomyces sp. LBUM 1485]KFG03264.1 ATP-binding protein [Streptomyces scabiei]MBP5883557.1 ATP-binding protein [Streptomyces sp. LBUM 1487]MBP5893617.1 ATP-binding protein [Streptomyces sp. LBUM 1481]